MTTKFWKRSLAIAGTVCVLAASITLGSVPARSQQASYPYSLRILSPVTVNGSSALVNVGYGINSAGTTCGGVYDGTVVRPYHSGANPVYLNAPGVAYAINDAGQAVGDADFGVGGQHGLFWDPSVPVYTDLGYNGAAGGGQSHAYGINSNSRLVGRFGNSPIRACYWDAAVKNSDGVPLLHELLTLPGGDDFGVARAINDSDVVAGYGTIGGSPRACIWSPANTPSGYGAPQSLGTLGGLNGFNKSTGWGISPYGQVVGQSTNSSGGLVPFLYDVDDTMYDLGGVSGSDQAYAMNDENQVVGGSSRAFIWDPVNGTRDLNFLIAPNSGYVLLAAYGINSAGQIIGQARDLGNSKVVAFQLTPIIGATLSGIRINAPSIVGGNSTAVVNGVQTPLTGTVDLGAVAPAGGVTLDLTSNDPAVTVPASVTIAAGQSSATFLITTTAVSLDNSVLITATQGSIAKSAVLTVQAPTPATVTAANVVGSQPTLGTVNLTGPAPAGGLPVLLSLDAASAGYVTVPPSVTVQSGLKSATFTVTTSAVATNSPATLTASYNPVSGSTDPTDPDLVSAPPVTFTVVAPTPQALTLAPASVYGGINSTGTVTLNAAAPAAGLVVPLNSSNTAVATVPPSVVILPGQRAATFTIGTVASTAPASATIKATYNGVTQPASLSVKAVALVGCNFSPTTVSSGSNTSFKVALTSPAPTGGVVVTLSSSKPKVVPLPKSVTVPAGALSTTISITTGKVTSSTAVTGSATYGVTKTANVTVTK